MEGWIKQHRKILDHYLFKEKRVFSKYEAWNYILLMANHKDNKFLLGNELIDLKAGQFVTSQSKLMEIFSWSKSKLKNFFSLLEKDNMIKIETDTKKTTLTIVKYRDYQEQETAERPQKDRKKTAESLRKDTNKNDNNDNNVKNDKPKKKKIFPFRQSLIDLGVEEQVAEDWMKVRKSKDAVNTETSFKRIKNHIIKSGRDPNECITLAVAKDWKGFEASWMDNELKKKNDGISKNEQRLNALKEDW